MRSKSNKLKNLREIVSTNSDKIRQLYQDGNSISWITACYGIGPKRRFLIEECLSGIELRGLKGNGGAKQIELAKITSLKKYGVENASSCPEIKERRKTTFNKRYGVDNPFQSEEIKNKMQQTWIANYGVPYSSASPNCQSALKTKRSRPHRLIEDLLDEEGIIYSSEAEIKGFKEGKRYRPRIDLLLQNNLGIEIYGDYFHANPRKYKPSDKIKRFCGYMLASDIWKQDKERISFIHDHGIRVIIIWEHDIKTDIGLIIDRIKNEIRKNSKD